MGDIPMLCKTLSVFGKVFYCTVDERGARVLKEE
jgi:hypothetical protein